MRERTAVALMALGIAFAAGVRAEPPDAEGWRFVREDDSIVVHRRAVAGSTLDELRGAGMVQAPVAAVLAVLQDRDHAKEWMYQCVESATLRQEPDGSFIVYNRTKLPWPLADRDAVVQGRRLFGADAVQIVFESMEYPAKPATAGVVRMPFVNGHWRLAPAEQGVATNVEYQVHADPGGALPTWVVNGFAKSLPYETIKGLRTQVARRRNPQAEQKLMELPEMRALLPRS